MEEELDSVALGSLVAGHVFEGCPEPGVGGFFGEDDVAIGGDGLPEGCDGQGLVVGELGEICGGEFFGHNCIIHEGGEVALPGRPVRACGGGYWGRRLGYYWL